ncbi:hypothetical protein ACIBEJ_47415 [Nonomuraea sp. NPDC050790]|uniref:hypothetical protein n=1 Tax=Nonomuraea sp. NPDC050790 TaxID=3364371 RepID=UPI003794C2DD
MTTFRRSTMRYLVLISAAAAGLFLAAPAQAAPTPPNEGATQTQRMPGDLLAGLTRGLPIKGLPVG